MRIPLLLAILGFFPVVIRAQAAGDNPCNATPLTVGTSCNFLTYSNATATASTGIPAPGCGNYLGGDVWFSAVVPASGVLIIDSNTGIITDGAMAMYTGTCNSLTLLACDDDGSANGLMPSISQSGLTPGTTVYIRFWDPNNNNNGTFQICAKSGAACTTQLSNANCASADPFCTGVSTDYCNTTGTASLGGGGIYGCLGSTPNPAFYFFQVSQSGTINFSISQTTNSGVGIDVDYVMWGPFATQSAMCSGLASTNIVACSYSTAAVETATITNAVAGQFYMVLITNFSDLPGVINFTQTNANQQNAGTTNCNIITAIPSSCNGSNYTVSGTLTVPAPPNSGTLTITNSCGGSVVYNAPFTSPINYSLPSGICGNGAACSVSAVFSAAGAPIISNATYNAPTCGTFTATPGACSGSTYVLSGTINPACPPNTGTLTIANSCGGSVVYNLPQTFPLNWSLPASSGNGGVCTVTATYSNAGAPVIPPITISEPTCCGVSAGTQTVTLTGGGLVNTLANGNKQVILCPSASVSIVADGNATFPVAGCASTPPPGCLPGLMYGIYNAAGPSGPDPDTDPNWTGYYWTGASFPGNNTQGLNVNNVGACSSILNLAAVTGFAPTNSPTNTLVFVPITADAVNLPNHDNNNDGCFDLGPYISVTYLNPIVFNVTNSCNGSMTVEINGGYPQFFPSLYTITNTGSGTLGSTQATSGGNVTVSGLTSGQTVSFSVTDASGCSYVFSRVYAAQSAPTINLTPVSTNLCAGCQTLTATINSGVSGVTPVTYSNSLCYAIPDGGVASTNTGQIATGSWASSSINVSGFCGATWQTGNPLSVTLNINHTYDADLNIFLQAPNGVLLSLSSDDGGAADNYTNTVFTTAVANVIGSGGNNNAPFTGNYAPDGIGGFSVFNNTSINGVWTLWLADDTPIDAGSLSSWSITFTPQNTYTYAWTASTGAAPANNSLTPTVCPAVSTVYTLTATNSCGCSSSASAGVTIVSPSSAGTNGNAVVCFNSPSIDLFSYLGGTPVTTGVWTGPAGAVISNGYLGTINPSSAPAGVYTYTVSAVGCPTASANVTLTIQPIPIVSYTGLTSICSGQSTALNLSSTPAGATFSWTVVQSGVTGAVNSSVGLTSINQLLTLTGAVAGTATYSVTAASNGCAGSPLNIVVNVLPVNTAGLPSSNPTVCAGVSISPVITISTTGATGIGAPSGLPPGVTASWSGNVITLSGSPGAVGVYNYIIPLTGGCGSVNAIGQITVIQANTVSNATSNPTICVNTALNPVITFTTTGATGIGAAVNLPAGLTATWNANTITISGTPTASGTFAYSIPLTGGCGNISATGTIVVNPAPSVSANAPSFTICAGPDALNASAPSITLTSPQAGTTYTWALYAGAAPAGIPVQTGTGTPNYLFTNTTCSDQTYVYQVTPNLNGCPGTPLNLTIIVRPKPTSSFTVTPNPVCALQTATVTYTGTSCPVSTYNWTWPAGVTVVSGTGAGPYVISFGAVAIATTYAIKLQVVGPASLGGCTSTQTTVNLVVNPATIPTFNPVGPYCSGAVVPPLPTTSTNGITGTWSPTISNTATTLYTFTPNAGQCATTASLTVTINPNITPAFTSVGPYCNGAVIPPLNTISNNGISGTWSPAINNTATTLYTFTPAVGQCANSTTLTVSITPNVIPTFSAVGPYCFGASIPALPTTSNNGITGAWSPAVNPNASTTYTFTPTAGQCATIAQLSIVVLDVIDWANLQFPGNAQICEGSSLTAYGQLYNTGAVNTPDPGAAAGVIVQIGYSSTNTNPNTWTTWQNASFNAQIGNNDEYQGLLSGLAPGTYYYTFRYQINGCSWQYGGYSAVGGGFWNGTTNLSGVLTVVPAPQAGADAAVSLCISGSPLNLFSTLGASAQTTGSWSGPAALGGGYLGTFNPSTYPAGTYIYTVPGGVCPSDFAIVTISITSSPSATIVYPSPLCNDITTSISPTISGSFGGSFSASPAGLTLSASGSFVPANSSVGTYTVTYTVPAANGCAAINAQTQVVIVAAPALPALSGTPLCSDTAVVFTAGNGVLYEFFVNGVSVGNPSSTNVLDTTGLSAGTVVCVRSYLSTPVMDGSLMDSEWPPYLPGTTGGPASLAPFIDSRLDGFKVLIRRGMLYGAIAGSEIDGATQAENNRVVLFIDSKPGGFNSLSSWTNRTGLPANTNGIINLNGNIVFDAGFEPDYLLAMNRANLAGVTYYDLYDMTANTNMYLGSSPSALLGFQENAFDGDLTKGFEFAFPLSAIGSPSVSIRFFGLMVNDPLNTQASLLSNQFITTANLGEGNYGNGSVYFSSALPNPVLVPIPPECFKETCLTINPTITPVFNPIAPICSGVSVGSLPTTSLNGIAGTWTPALNTSVTTTYTFTPSGGGCATTTTLTINVNTPPTTSGVLHD